MLVFQVVFEIMLYILRVPVVRVLEYHGMPYRVVAGIHGGGGFLPLVCRWLIEIILLQRRRDVTMQPRYAILDEYVHMYHGMPHTGTMPYNMVLQSSVRLIRHRCRPEIRPGAARASGTAASRRGRTGGRKSQVHCRRTAEERRCYHHH